MQLGLFMPRELRNHSLDYLLETYKPQERKVGVAKPFILFLGVSGVGKSTIMREMIATRPDLYTYISPFTTRPLREGEIDKVHVSQGEYVRMLKEGEFVYDNPLYGVNYGTPKKSITQAFVEGRIPLLDFPLEDVPKLHLPEDITPVGIYCFPPNISEWYKRMAEDGRQNMSRLHKGYRELESLALSETRNPNIDFALVTRSGQIQGLAEQVHGYISSLRSGII